MVTTTTIILEMRECGSDRQKIREKWCNLAFGCKNFTTRGS